MISVSEGLVGQLYLVSAVALLVGNIGRSIRGEEEALTDERHVPAAGVTVAPVRASERADSPAPPR